MLDYAAMRVWISCFRKGMEHTHIIEKCIFKFFFFSRSAAVSVEHPEPQHVILEICRSLQTFQNANSLQHLQPCLIRNNRRAVLATLPISFFLSCKWDTVDFSSNDFHMK